MSAAPLALRLSGSGFRSANGDATPKKQAKQRTGAANDLCAGSSVTSERGRGLTRPRHITICRLNYLVPKAQKKPRHSHEYVIGQTPDGFYVYNFGNLKKAASREEIYKYLLSTNDAITIGSFFVDNDEDIGYKYLVSAAQSLTQSAFDSAYLTMAAVAAERRTEIRQLLDSSTNKEERRPTRRKRLRKNPSAELTARNSRRRLNENLEKKRTKFRRVLAERILVLAGALAAFKRNVRLMIGGPPWKAATRIRHHSPTRCSTYTSYLEAGANHEQQFGGHQS